MKLLAPENFDEDIKLYTFKKIKDRVYTVLLPSFLVQFDNGKAKECCVEIRRLNKNETKMAAVERISKEFENCYYFFYERSLSENEFPGMIRYKRIEENVEA
ncbi:MAG: hypothetical protein Q7K54_05010 [Candidatus Parcubacteria bacterium]|nr:hypothetical protein [Candidatus Parcubacteria bacterium]